jgi:hypothetical protein
MAFIHDVLEEPSYGWKDANGEPFKTNTTVKFSKNFFPGLNIFKTKKNWLSFMSWGMVVFLLRFLLSCLFSNTFL